MGLAGGGSWSCVVWLRRSPEHVRKCIIYISVFTGRGSVATNGVGYWTRANRFSLAGLVERGEESEQELRSEEM